MEEKDINLDNEEEILKVFDFDYCYNSEKCSRELCMFYNDISKQNNNFNERQAFVDLGIIAITLNQQDKRIKELEEENQQLKQQFEEYKKIQSFDNEEKTKSYLDTLTKPRIIELCLQFIYDKNCLKQQLESTQNSYNKTMKYLNTIRSKLLSLPDKIIEDIKNTAYINSYGDFFIDKVDLDKILKKYGG